MTHANPQHLPVDVTARIDAYLDAVRSSMAGVDPEVVDDTVEALRAHLAEELEAEPTLDRVAAALEALGPADCFAAPEAGEHSAKRPMPSAGTVLGMPYDVRIPTAERVASRWWNPGDPRIFMPRVFGIGWTVNFGAVAVRLRLIEPDAEEAPFAAVPQRVFVAALAVPVLLTAALLASFVAMRSVLPARLPIHWALSGQPDDFAGQAVAVGLLLALAGLPTFYAVAAVALKRPPLNQGVSIAFAAFFSAVAASVWVITLVTALTSFVSPWLPLLIVAAAFFVPAAVLVILARIGRAEEIRSDLGR